MGISSMNATINYNRKLLKNGKRVPFTKMNGGSGKKQSYKPYVFPEVQPHVLRRIRIKTRRQNRRLLIKQLIIGLVTLVIIVYLLYFSM
ncbi:hypothetical protein [uncultured Psychroserpens sp.]|uniref:hypothetical protein n=1 Tax=uncultured Psychroserpens sp. TaxID=255436 RepID=UPI00261EDEB4|nr:hypothetical protein [uncultured Psychroserpens sp.]